MSYDMVQWRNEISLSFHKENIIRNNFENSWSLNVESSPYNMLYMSYETYLFAIKNNFPGLAQLNII